MKASMKQRGYVFNQLELAADDTLEKQFKLPRIFITTLRKIVSAMNEAQRIPEVETEKTDEYTEE